MGAATPKVHRATVRAFTLLRGHEMSRSEFERENIGPDALSAAAAAYPAPIPALRPPAEGLYDPRWKRTCGVGFIANIKGKKSHQIVSDALNILCNLEHRGAVGADRAPATAPASWCRSRTPSSPARPRSSASHLPNPAPTPSARCSCRRKRPGGRSSRASSPTRSRPRG